MQFRVKHPLTVIPCAAVPEKPVHRAFARRLLVGLLYNYEFEFAIYFRRNTTQCVMLRRASAAELCLVTYVLKACPRCVLRIRDAPWHHYGFGVLCDVAQSDEHSYHTVRINIYTASHNQHDAKRTRNDNPHNTRCSRTCTLYY